MVENKVVAMLLAGGQGSRLKALTRQIAKPAVPFGGKYRIIDFALSNSTNSGISDIGILTQYKPYLLNSHIGIGQAWDYDRNVGGLRVLPPFTSEDGGRWYTGTANAIYENIDYLDELNPENVLILSGDHIYKMDYRQLIKAHKEKAADVTLSVIEVPWEDASRFGIVNTDGDNKIVKFDEKPENPKNNMASMGIYVFNWKELREALIQDEKDEESSKDFGKDILPKMLEEGKSLYAWNYGGYWRDVGTIRSYWEANMDLIRPDNELDMYDSSWRIYTRNRNLPPHYLARSSVVKNSLINEGCIIEGKVDHSVLFSDIIIEKDAKVSNTVVMSDSTVEAGAEINNAIILEGVTVKAGQKIGKKDDGNIYVITKKGFTIE